MSAVISPANPGFVFRWETPRRRRLSLIAFIAGSALLHALCFYLFQIAYPPAVALLPAPARVTLISPSSPDGQVLLRWINAEDPALASTTQRLPDSKLYALPKVEHVASYLTNQPDLKEIPLPKPSASPAGPFPVAPVARIVPPAPADLPVAKTSLAFSEEFSRLGSPFVPEMKFTNAELMNPAAAQFLVAADARGEIRFCFLQNSSGSAALDEQARKFLALVRFENPALQNLADTALLWGRVTVQWGSDIALPPRAKTP